MSDLGLEAAKAKLLALIADEGRKTAALGPRWALQVAVTSNPNFFVERLAYGFAETFTLETRRFEVIEGETAYLFADWSTYGPWPLGYSREVKNDD